MWSTWWPRGALCAAALLVACGEDSGDDGGGGAGGSTAGGGSAGIPGLPPGSRIVRGTEALRTGECMSPADCSGASAPGTVCATMAGSYKVCAVQTPVATAATTPAGECDPNRP